MFSAVVTRFTTYGIAASETASTYIETMMAHPWMVEWIEAARAEPWVIDKYEL